jgi:extradiol dioxygenase family protein
MESKFHISLPCMHIEATEKFYSQIVGGTIGRKEKNWVDINLYQHQLTFTKSGIFHFEYPKYSFEKTILPSFHFGIILDITDWLKLYQKLKSKVYIDVATFLKNKPGEHQSFYLMDPNGYVIEFKCFSDNNGVFKT